MPGRRTRRRSRPGNGTGGNSRRSRSVASLRTCKGGSWRFKTSLTRSYLLCPRRRSRGLRRGTAREARCACTSRPERPGALIATTLGSPRPVAISLGLLGAAAGTRPGWGRCPRWTRKGTMSKRLEVSRRIQRVQTLSPDLTSKDHGQLKPMAKQPRASLCGLGNAKRRNTSGSAPHRVHTTHLDEPKAENEQVTGRTDKR
ncbi:hypothetical protein MAPG_09695 [Magnaporthiopsis poae ATCC 64411]|uniref:Uncharacterized protein n=1 Tax=Magnaporthiopsis poae (strain ATCC 64411 / 73-15) TaxID=644358 RepID=A0A0C4EAM0_MAGP6|nr:hypothetical protein MAPG_09695 [Magnaporthiopsis poae ATCC 64411]